MPGRPWTPAEESTLRHLWHTHTAAQIGNRLNRSEKSIYQRAHSMGLSRARPQIFGKSLEKFIRQKHKLGWSDPEIADAYGKLHNWTMDRHTVGKYRRRLGLPINRFSEHCRRRVAEKTQEQCEAAGVDSLAEIRSKAFRDYADRNGWPESLSPRAIQILNLLYDQGPKTRREICDGIGLTWRGSRNSLKSNDPGGTYLAYLLKLGLVSVMEKARRVIGQGSGYNQNAYMIPLSVKRGEPKTWSIQAREAMAAIKQAAAMPELAKEKTAERGA